MEVFGSSGTRGVANETLTPEFALQVAMAAGTVFESDRVALARDTRTTGEMLTNAAASGLVSVGLDVDDLGIVPTPGLQTYAATEDVPGVMITASHNPPDYNGIKLVAADGGDLAIADLEHIEDVLQIDAAEPVSWDAVGAVNEIGSARRRYRETIAADVDRERIAEGDLTVAIDPGHGAGSLTSPDLFRDLGCRVVTVNAQPDGHFPGRDPEPIEQNLDDLKRLVRTTEADVGIAHDGDADRAIFVDEDGEYLEGDATFAALAARELNAGDTLVSAVNVSQRLVDVVEDADADLELTPIGSTHIMDRIRSLRAEGENVPIAGEGNGGVFFPPHLFARDGAYTAARFLELLAERPASEVADAFSGYHNVRRNVGYDDQDEREDLMAAIADYAAEMEDDGGSEVTTIDGYRVDCGDAWVLARPSGTEPLIRVYAEARDRERAEELVETLLDRLDAGKA